MVGQLPLPLHSCTGAIGDTSDWAGRWLHDTLCLLWPDSPPFGGWRCVTSPQEKVNQEPDGHKVHHHQNGYQGSCPMQRMWGVLVLNQVEAPMQQLLVLMSGVVLNERQHDSMGYAMLVQRSLASQLSSAAESLFPACVFSCCLKELVCCPKGTIGWSSTSYAWKLYDQAHSACTPGHCCVALCNIATLSLSPPFLRACCLHAPACKARTGRRPRELQ